MFFPNTVTTSAEPWVDPENSVSGDPDNVFVVVVVVVVVVVSSHQLFHRGLYEPLSRGNWTQKGPIASRGGPYQYFKGNL